MNFNSLVLDHYDMMKTKQITDSMLKEAGLEKTSFMHEDDLNRHKSEDFAMVIALPGGDRLHKFPICSRVDTAFSQDSFKKNAAKLPESIQKMVARNIAAACERYSIDVEKSIAKLASADAPEGNLYVPTRAEVSGDLEKTASNYHYAVNESLDGRPIQRFPINTPEEIASALQRFSTSSMPVKYASQIAQNVIPRARELGYAIPSDHPVWLMTSTTLSPLFKIAMQDRIRQSSGTHRSRYEALLEKAASCTPGVVANALEILDTQSGLRFKWNRGIVPAIDTAMGWPKSASTVDLNGKQVDIIKLRKVAETLGEELEDMIGKDAVEALRTDTARAFMALPAPHQQATLNLIDRVG